jgi:glucosamine-6-phosphate deaminase
MRIVKHPEKAGLGRAAAEEGVAAIRAAIADHGAATIVLATGASQFEMLAFHLDEYVGLPESHGASFRRYLRERVIGRAPAFADFFLIEGDAADLRGEVERLNTLISGERIDVCFAGIGENCHLAFNDPPADFTTDAPYLIVDLDAACRQQQLGEGWFDTLDDVPQRAISMSIRQFMKARKIVLSVPDARKAEAVRHAVAGPVSPDYPASIVQTHGDCSLHLDPASAALLAD